MLYVSSLNSIVAKKLELQATTAAVAAVSVDMMHYYLGVITFSAALHG